MADYQSFKVKPSAYLGFEYQKFQNQMYAIAMSDPKKYFEIRDAVVDYVRDKTVESWHEVFYSVLTDGTKVDGGVIHNDLPAPKYPPQDVCEICLSIGKTVEEISDKIIDKLVPARFEDLAHKRSGDKSAALGL